MSRVDEYQRRAEAEGVPEAPQFAADHVRLYAEHKALLLEVEKLRAKNEDLYQQNRTYHRQLDALYKLIERLD